MRVVELIEKKRAGKALTASEIHNLIAAYTEGNVPDYQMSAFAMAVCWRGMTAAETAALTEAMAKSGQQLDLSAIPGVKVDKHSTGGVGDKTTLVLGPLVAAVGVPVAKMSGRGLGHTGGTIDKLESIPGFRADLSMEDFLEQVRRIGIAVAGQTHDLAPADKALYALRDVTGTVSSIPLIASSIMSKKLASGADAIVLDVKVGEGAFMKSRLEARHLAETMVRIGQAAGRRTVALLTAMDQPLGQAVGNALEVREAIATLKGAGPRDLRELCLALGSHMVVSAGRADDERAARSLLEQALASGAALAKFKEFVAAQGGNPAVAEEPDLLPTAPVIHRVTAPRGGVIRRIHAEAVGLVAMRLGAGRAKRDDVIDPAVGIVLTRKAGEPVKPGEPIAEIHAQTAAAAAAAEQELLAAVEIFDGAAFEDALILDVVKPGGAGQDEHAAQALVTAAREAMAGAYVPYSQFAVGAALRLDTGEVVVGANVENASYGLTNCAERTAIFKYVTSGARARGERVVEVAVVADSEGPVAPCGACRQVLAEFCAADTPVHLANLNGQIRRTTVGELLPCAFDAGQMNVDRTTGMGIRE